MVTMATPEQPGTDLDDLDAGDTSAIREEEDAVGEDATDEGSPAEGRGVVVLLRDLHMRLAHGHEASPQTLRQYGVGAQILSALGLSRITLLSNSPKPRVVGLEAYGLEIAGTRPITEGP